MVTTDLIRIQRILDPLFLQVPVKIMAKNSAALQAQVQSIRDTSVHVAHGLGEAQSYILMAEHKGYDFFLKCETLEHMRSGSLVRPVRALVKPSLRKEERHAVDQRNAPVLSGLMLYQEFLASFAILDTKRDQQIQIHKRALRELLPEQVSIEFLLRKSSHMNLRMRTLDKLRLPILIPDKNSPSHWIETEEYRFLPFPEYEKVLRTESWNRSFLSEICEPLIYKNELTFGYIRVHSINPLDLKSYQIVHHIARKFERFIESQSSLPILTQSKANIFDISHSGLACIYPMNKELYQKLQNGETVIFDLKFPTQKQESAFTAKIRSGFQQGSHLRLGLEFLDNTKEQQALIDTCIEENEAATPPETHHSI